MSIFGKAVKGFGMLKKSPTLKTIDDTAKLHAKMIKKHPKTHAAVGAAGLVALHQTQKKPRKKPKGRDDMKKSFVKWASAKKKKKEK